MQMGPIEAGMKANAKAIRLGFMPASDNIVRCPHLHLSEAEKQRIADVDALLAKYRWSDVRKGQGCDLSAKDIVKSVADKHRVTVAQIHGSRRYKDIVRARQEAMFDLDRFKGWSSIRIGYYFGKDHTTVLHALRSHAARLEAMGAL